MICVLALRPKTLDQIAPTTGVILAHLSLLFVPAGVGVIGNLSVLSDDWPALLTILVLSTLLAMLGAVGTFIAVSRLTDRNAD